MWSQIRMRHLVLEQLPMNDLCSSENIAQPVRQTFHSDSLSTCLNHRFISSDVFCSFEFTPPKCNEDLRNLVERASRLQDACNPLFHAVTSHVTSSSILEHPGLQLTRSLGRENCTLLHLVAEQLTMSDVRKILDQARADGVRNIFALRGDQNQSLQSVSTSTDFPFAVNLVAFIRENYGPYFTICVAGYPHKHPQATSYRQDILYLKQKVLAGADFIITQVVLDSNSFIQFVNDCKMSGITVPIIPGILAIQSYQALVQMSRLCQFNVPKQMLLDLKPIAHNDQAVVNYYLFQAVQMIKKLFTLKITAGVHIFTLNRDKVPMELCRQLGLCQAEPSRTLLWLTKSGKMEENQNHLTAESLKKGF